MNKLADQKKSSSFLGALTMQTFDKNIWEDIKQKILPPHPYTLEGKKEKLFWWQQLLQLLLQVNECSDYKQYFRDISIQSFFFKDFLLPIVKSLVHKDFDKDDNDPVFDSCLQQILILWIKAFDENDSFLEKIASFILNSISKYYQQKKHPFLKEHTSSEPIPQHFIWLERLRIGDIIDCVKCEPKYKKMSWSHARIDKITEFSIKVCFLGDSERVTKEFNKIESAHEMAPYKSKCIDFEGRMSLQKGDELYVFWKKKMWTPATVIDTQEFLLEDKKNSTKKVRIGYRIYSQEGKIMDTERRRYTGWSAKNDEWLCSTDPLLCLKNSHKDFCQLDFICDDSSDMVAQGIKGNKIYVISRSYYCDSNSFIRLVNEFGEKGGFERIVQRISNKENWAPIKTVYRLCGLVGNLTPILHREFALEYIPKLKEAVWRNILESPEWNVKNFTYFKINKIWNAFIKLLGRIYSPSERKDIIVAFKFQVCSAFLECQHLPVKLQGLKMISKFIRIIEHNTAKNFWSSSNSELNNFLIKSKILLKICLFNDDNNKKFAKMFESIAKYMEENGLIDSKVFEELCSAILEGNKESRLIFYQLFSKIALDLMEPIYCESFIANFCKIPTKEIIEEDMKFLLDLCSKSEISTIISRILYNFCWEVISDESRVAPGILNYAFFISSRIIKNINSDPKEFDMLAEDCINNIQKNISVITSLKIFLVLCNNHTIWDKTSQLEYLCEEKNLLGLLLENFKQFKSDLRTKLNSNPKYSEHDIDSLINDGFSYKEHARIRIDILRHLVSIIPLKEKYFSYKFLCDIWDTFIKESLTAEERYNVYKILKLSISNLKKQGIVIFFRDKMEHKFLASFGNISETDFNFFKNIFLEVNESLGRITVRAGATPFSQVTIPSISVHPNKIEGIDILWAYVWIPENNIVSQKAIELLDLLYSNVDLNFISQLQEIRQQTLDRCNEYLTETLNNRSSLTQNLFKTRCLRYLNLIENTIDSSETQGSGDLQRHLRPDKELITLEIINNMKIPLIMSSRVEIIIDLNSTCFDLILEVARAFKVSPEIVLLEKGGVWSRDYMKLDHKNGRTLKDLKFVKKQRLTAKRSSPNSTQLKKLFQVNNSMNPLAKDIFISLFNKFSENEKMSPEQLAIFNHSCTGDNCLPDDRRVSNVFMLFDQDRDGFLTIEDFLELYNNACAKNPEIALENLISHKYTYNLKKFDQIKPEKVDRTSLLRYFISINNSYFQKIYSLLELEGEEVINIKTLNLLNRLPTSSNKLIEIINFRGSEEKTDFKEKSWKTFFDKNSKAQLVYSLQIMDLLTRDPINDKRVTQIKDKLLSQDSNILDKIESWKLNFVKDKGLNHLLDIIQNLTIKFRREVDIINSRIISICLKILGNYLKPLLEASSVVEGDKKVSLMRLLDEALIFLKKKMDLYQENGSNEVSNVEPEEMEKLKNLSTRLGNELDLEISIPSEITYILEATTRLWNYVFADSKSFL